MKITWPFDSLTAVARTVIPVEQYEQVLLFSYPILYGLEVENGITAQQMQ